MIVVIQDLYRSGGINFSETPACGEAAAGTWGTAAGRESQIAWVLAAASERLHGKKHVIGVSALMLDWQLVHESYITYYFLYAWARAPMVLGKLRAPVAATGFGIIDRQHCRR